MEAAAVVAFADLERELAAHGAPEELLARVRRACHDEIGHAAIMEAQARRLGAQVPAVTVAERPRPSGERSLLAIAIDNAVEGCVREAYGALVALYQARHARDAELRVALSRVAADEIAHAELSLDLAEWLDTKLGPAERALVARERDRAVAELARECALLDPAPPVVRACGMPTSRTATAMLRELLSRSGARDRRAPAGAGRAGAASAHA